MEIDGTRLPSKCLPYNIDPTTIKIRTLKGKDEKLLAEMNINNVDKQYTILLNNVISGIKAEDLTLGDRTWILIWLRVNSFSTTLPTQLNCSTCYEQINVDLDLLNIPEKTLPDTYSEPFVYKISDELTLNLKLSRVKDELESIDNTVKNGISNSYWSLLAKTIVNEKSFKENINWLDEQDVSVIQKIKQFQTEFEHGPEVDKVPYTCPKCGSKGVVTLPFRPDFLITQSK